MKNKICIKCKIEKDSSKFYKDKTKKDGLCSYCKECDNKKYKKLAQKYTEQNIQCPVAKCSKCERVLDATNFTKNSMRKNGLSNICKQCQKIYKQKVYENNLKIEKYNSKKCYKCKKIKEPSNFYKDISSVGGLSNICKQCSSIVEAKRRPIKRAQAKKRYKNSPEKFLQHTRKRHALQKNVNENYTPDDALITENAFKNKCFKCGSKINLCKDHHLPLSERNPLTIFNAVLLCKKCNSSKGTKNPKEFYTKKELRLLQDIFQQIKKIMDRVLR